MTVVPVLSSTEKESAVLKIRKSLFSSSAIFSSRLGSDNYEGIEALFISRGEEIKKLTDVEQKISKTISKTPSKTAEPLIKDYITTRNKLFEDILDQNKNLDRDLRAVRETVLTEIKSLNRGKKMHQRYVDASTLNSGFIDVKE
ncbi:hypothetical protein ACFL6I_27260 [candidate division KSB1 bacterium]